MLSVFLNSDRMDRSHRTSCSAASHSPASLDRTNVSTPDGDIFHLKSFPVRTTPLLLQETDAATVHTVALRSKKLSNMRHYGDSNRIQMVSAMCLTFNHFFVCFLSTAFCLETCRLMISMLDVSFTRQPIKRGLVDWLAGGRCQWWLKLHNVRHKNAGNADSRMESDKNASFAEL